MRMEIESEAGTHRVEIERHGESVRARVDGRSYELKVFQPEPGVYTLLLGPRVVEVHVEGNAQSESVRATVRERLFHLRLVNRGGPRRASEWGSQERVSLTARMPGKVVRLLAEAGSLVQVGQGILVLEAMKMQNEVKAPRSGRLAEIRVREGQTVGAGELLAIIE